MVRGLNTLALNSVISEDAVAFLEAYSLPTGVIDIEGQWLYKNSVLNQHLALLDKRRFFALLEDKQQENAVKKLIIRNKRMQLAETRLIKHLAKLMACSARVKLANSDLPVFLIEFRPRTQHLHAFSSLNRLYREQTRYEKKTLTTDIRLQRAVSESRTDPLTKIANRRVLEEHLLLVWAQAFISETPFSFLILDLDFFKKINDVYGHTQGDNVLVSVAETLKSHVKRSGDMVARLGGEEFSVLLPNTDIAGSECVAEKLRVAVRHLDIPNSESDTADYLTVSIGWALLHKST